MASSDQQDDRRRSEAEVAAEGAPEADVADQRASAVPGEEADWIEDASQGAFEEANEADVIEQSLDAGDDDEERR